MTRGSAGKWDFAGSRMMVGAENHKIAFYITLYLRIIVPPTGNLMYRSDKFQMTQKPDNKKTKLVLRDGLRILYFHILDSPIYPRGGS